MSTLETPVAGDMFRAEALRSADPPGTAAPLRPVRPAWWAGLGALVITVVAALCWAAFARPQSTISGGGILLGPQGIATVASADQGVVVRLDFARGDHVRPGQTLAVVQAPNGARRSLTSVVGGTVLLRLINAGDFVTPGEDVAEVLPTVNPAAAIALLPAADAADLHVGEAARVAPQDAPAASYGSIEARVSSFTSIPLSASRLLVLTGGNGTLARQIAPSSDVILVTLRLARSRTSASGYRWTSGRGPAFAIPPATPLAVSVITGGLSPLGQLLGG